MLPAICAGLVLPLGFAGPNAGSETGPSSLKPLQAAVRQIDGGPDFYSRFKRSLPVRADFFPIALWSASLVDSADLSKDRAAGINTYVELPDGSNPALAESVGSALVPSTDIPAAAGFLLGDEIDMWGGAGGSAWSGHYPGQGDICIPASAKCGFTILRDIKARAPHDAPLFANYGKGVLFWDSNPEAREFVAQADVVSADAYWFTDPGICAADQGGALVGYARALVDPSECRRPGNYGWAVDRVRDLVVPAHSKPVWAVVELGHPFPEGSVVRPDDVRAAVWSSIIHGARGIIYFDHSFGGSCPTLSVVRQGCDPALSKVLSDTDNQITELAPVLNAPFVDSAVEVHGSADAIVKVLDGNLYLFAQSTSQVRQTVVFSLPCSAGRGVEVVDEARTINTSGSYFSDTFAGDGAVHIYSLGPNRCGL
ncbi:hypothetical protein GCM10027090_33870 [Sinomonas soli]